MTNVKQQQKKAIRTIKFPGIEKHQLVLLERVKTNFLSLQTVLERIFSLLFEKATDSTWFEPMETNL